MDVRPKTKNDPVTPQSSAQKVDNNVYRSLHESKLSNFSFKQLGLTYGNLKGSRSVWSFVRAEFTKYMNLQAPDKTKE
jgi:hypothetical protein